jgi:hypothetical protein
MKGRVFGKAVNGINNVGIIRVVNLGKSFNGFFLASQFVHYLTSFLVSASIIAIALYSA